MLIASVYTREEKKLRQKREWIIPAQKLKENHDYTHYDYIAKIHSDEEMRTSIRYSLKGKGADEPPRGLFTVGVEDGKVRVHAILDREETDSYSLLGFAKLDDGTDAEKPIILRIQVLDQNDCAPQFSPATGEIKELSQKDTFVMMFTARDADLETTNIRIAYRIVQQSKPEMFRIDRNSGAIYVKSIIDREVIETATLIVQGTDLDGSPKGLSGTGNVTINIKDVNDNIPTLEKNSFECSVEENTKNIEVLRIQAIDADLIYSENWLAVFTIISGNEGGYFSITTDHKTNQGILMLNKELDYEQLKELNLQLSISNVAAYHSSVLITESSKKLYRVKVSVINQPEGPRFQPAVKVITVSEESTNIILNKVITNYAAIDSDTLTIATNVRYAKEYDIDNWLIIDEKTADIRLNKVPDFESKFLINNTYYARIICITNEAIVKTATGTIAIQVNDTNDHCPVLVQQTQTLCYQEQALYLTALDKDQFPNGVPFGFEVDAKNTKESWRVEILNDTTAIFRSKHTLWPGMYQLYVNVWDQQGKICASQELRVQVCSCDTTRVCRRERVVIRFGVSGVLLMLLALLILLLAPLLLLFCLCGASGAAADFKTIPFDVKEHLIQYNIESQGEDQAVALVKMKEELDKNQKEHVDAVGGGKEPKEKVNPYETHHWYHFNNYEGVDHSHKYRWSQLDLDHQYAWRKQHWSSAFDGLALPDAFLRSYYYQKSDHVATKQETVDHLKTFDYEGHDSHAESFEDICNLFHEEDEDLSFLNDLGLQFKTLAEICSGSSIKTETSTQITVTTKPNQSGSQKETNIHEMVGVKELLKKEHSSTSIQTHQTSSVTSGGCVHDTIMVQPSTTVFVQQPSLYYTSATPLYVLDSHPAVLVTPAPILGFQEKVMVEEKKKKISGGAKGGSQHLKSLMLQEKQPVKTTAGVSGTVRITEITERSETRGSQRESRGVQELLLQQ
ncbi:hypothetical protein DNTS_030475 [Danionella cerebrum]|uniref:Cadherin domain-containing protein n=1 Tax=Danionella cerebrum TaxID=2873325 RepID=A0A553MM18_9TELE|nr:hypothetical protein DNTS_030475 [Danionella translucida]